MFDEIDYLNLCDEVQNCENCFLCKHQFNDKIVGRKTKLSLEFLEDKNKCLILWIGQNPYHSDRSIIESVHKTFGRNDGTILRKLCGDTLLKFSAFTNLIRCSTDKNIANISIKKCLLWLEKDVNLIKPKYLIFLGKISSNYFNKKFGDKIITPKYTIYFLPHPGTFKYHKNDYFLQLYFKTKEELEKDIHGIFNI